MNEELRFRVYSRRWGHYDTYELVRTSTGWNVSHLAINGDCEPNGNPYLISNLKQDNISYPSNFPQILETFWNHIDEENLDRDQIQEKIDELANWISITENNKPSWSPYY